MSLPIFTADVSGLPSNSFINVYLTSPSAGVGHSAHPQNYKSPAHVTLRNESSAVFEIAFDGSGFTANVPSYSTTVQACSPADNTMTLNVLKTTSLTTGSGETNLLSCAYYFPGEPLPHPMGK